MPLNTPQGRVNPAFATAAGVVPRDNPAEMQYLQQAQIDSTNSFERGIQSADYATMANSLATDAIKAKAAGDERAYAELMARAEQHQQQAAQWAPAVPTLKDAHSPGDYLSWAAGAGGSALRSSVPSAIGALGGAGLALATRGRVSPATLSTVGSFIPAYNAEMEDSTASMWNDPQARARNTPDQILNYGRAAGAIKAVPEAFAPLLVAGNAEKIAAQAGMKGMVKQAGREMLKDMAYEGGTEGAQDVADQMVQNRAAGRPLANINWEQAGESAAQGAVGGGMLAMPGTVAGVTKRVTGNVADTARDWKENPGQKVGDLLADAGGVVGNAAGKVESYFKDKADDAALAKMAEEMSQPKANHAFAGPETAEEKGMDDVGFVNRRNELATQRAKEILADTNASQRERDAAARHLADPNFKLFGDQLTSAGEANHRDARLGTIANEIEGKAGKPSKQGLTEHGKVMSQLSDIWLRDHSKGVSLFDGHQDAPETKRTATTLMSWIASDFGAKHNDGEAFIPHSITDELGEDAPKVVSSMIDLAKRQQKFESTPEREKEVIDALAQRANSATGDHTFVEKNMLPTAWENMTPERTTTLMNYLRGNAGEVSPAGRTGLVSIFGNNTDAILDHFKRRNEERNASALVQTHDEEAIGAGSGHRSVQESDNITDNDEGYDSGVQIMEPAEPKAEYVGFGSKNTPFDTDYQNAKNEHDRLLQHYESSPHLGKTATSVGVVDMAKRKFDADVAAGKTPTPLEKVHGDLIQKYAREFDPGPNEDLGQYHERVLRDINKRVRAIEVKDVGEKSALEPKPLFNARPDQIDGVSSRDYDAGVNNAEGLRAHRNPNAGNNTPKHGVLYLERREGTNENGEPAGKAEAFPLNVGNLIRAVRAHGKEDVNNTKSNAHSTLNDLLQGLAALRSGGHGFTGRWGVMRDGKFTMLKDGKLPLDLKIAKDVTVGQAMKSAAEARREEKSGNRVRYAETHGEKVAELLRLAKIYGGDFAKDLRSLVKVVNNGVVEKYDSLKKTHPDDVRDAFSVDEKKAELLRLAKGVGGQFATSIKKLITDGERAIDTKYQELRRRGEPDQDIVGDVVEADKPSNRMDVTAGDAKDQSTSFRREDPVNQVNRNSDGAIAGYMGGGYEGNARGGKTGQHNEPVNTDAAKAAAEREAKLGEGDVRQAKVGTLVTELRKGVPNFLMNAKGASTSRLTKAIQTLKNIEHSSADDIARQSDVTPEQAQAIIKRAKAAKVGLESILTNRGENVGTETIGRAFGATVGITRRDAGANEPATGEREAGVASRGDGRGTAADSRAGVERPREQGQSDKKAEVNERTTHSELGLRVSERRGTDAGQGGSSGQSVGESGAGKGEKATRERHDAEATPEQVRLARDEIMATVGIEAMLGKEFGDGRAGSWKAGKDGATNTIWLAMTDGIMGAARHESFHEFFDMLGKHGGEKVREVLERVATNPILVRKMEQLLHASPEAQAQLKSPEEAAAFMYQFWRSGQIKLGPQAESLFQRITNFFKSILGKISAQVRDEMHAEQIMRAFSQGVVADSSQREAVIKALNTNAELHSKAMENVGKTNNALVGAFGKLTFSSEAMLERTGSKPLAEIAKRFNQKYGEAKGEKAAYFDEVRATTNRYLSKLDDIMAMGDKKDAELVREYLANGKEPTDAKLKEMYNAVHGLFNELYDYATTKGVTVYDSEVMDAETGTKGAWVALKKRQNYFPQVWDTGTIMEKQQGLKDTMLTHNMAELEAIAKQANADIKKNRATDPTHAAGIAKGKGLSEVTPEMVAEAIVIRMLNANGKVDLSESTSDLGISPMTSAVNKRTLDWMKHPDYDQFKSKDLANIVSSYIAGMVKRAEYQNRFGSGGEGIKTLVDEAVLDKLGGKALVDKANEALPNAVAAWKKAKGEFMKEHKDEEFPVPYPTVRSVGQSIHQSQVGADESLAKLAKVLKELEPGFNSIMAMEGTLGSDISPALRKLNSTLVTYQNFRLLSLMLFQGMGDIMGIVTNGGTLNDAWRAFVEGMKEIRNTIKNVPTEKGSMMHRGEIWGAVDAGHYANSLGQTWSSTFTSGKAKKLIDGFFKYTGAEGWNRGVRAVAASVAERRILQYRKMDKANMSKAEKAMFERLYGTHMEPGDIKLDENGQLDIYDPYNQAAVNRWVLDSVVSPNAAHRPAWASDPHFAAIFHLKNFTYSFHRTILMNAVKQAELGNYRPALTLLVGYTPVMIAADAVKEMLIPGDDPPWMDGSLADYIGHGFTRAGVLGVPQMAYDSFTRDFGASLLGPTISQVANVPFKTPSEDFLGAMPLGNIVGRYADHD